MARPSEDTGINTFSMDVVPRVSGQAPVVVGGSDGSSLTEGDLAILNRLQFLADRVELLEHKLDNTLHNVRGSSDGDLAENFAQDYGVINSFQVNVLTGPSCKQNDYYSGEGEADSTSFVTRETWENADTEQTTSFLIIPVGNNKDHEGCTLQSEKQTLLAPEKSLALPECITSNEGDSAECVRSSVAEPSTRAILPPGEPSTPRVSAENDKASSSETPNQTMFSTASIELAPCLPSPSTRAHERQRDSPEASLCDLNVSSNSSGNRAGSTSGQCHSLTYGYTISLARAKVPVDAGRPSEVLITKSAVRSDQYQDPEGATPLRQEGKERKDRSTVAFTPNSNEKLQYCVAASERSGYEAISDGETCDSGRQQNKMRFTDKTIKSGFQLSKQCHEAGDFIYLPSNAPQLEEKPGWSLDVNHNLVKQSRHGALERGERGRISRRGDAISEDVHTKRNGDGLMTNGNDHYDRTSGNYDQSKSAQIEMQMRSTAAQRPKVAGGAVESRTQAVDHSTNNASSEKFVNSHRIPAVYNGAHCVNNQASVSEDSDRIMSESCYERNCTRDARNARDGLPYQRAPAHVNGRAERVANARSTTNAQVPSEGSLSRQDSGQKLRSSDPRKECSAREQSFEEQLRNLIDPEAISPALGPERPFTPLQKHPTLAERSEPGRQSMGSPITAQRNPVGEIERRYGPYRGYHAHPSPGRADSSSDSPYSSLTSVSSALDQSAENSALLDSGNTLRNGRYEERASNSPSVSFISSDFSSAAESDAFRSFRLSPLSQNKRALPPLHCAELIRHNPEDNGCQLLSSPTSSLDASDVSVIDSFTECQCLHECECQTGIPTEEDFIEELKAISRYVLSERQKAGAPGPKTNARYFLDEEHGEMEGFGAQVRGVGTHRAVPMLVKVILRLRKHFFGTVDSASPTPASRSPKLPPKKSSQDCGSTKPGRRISFSPSAVLLSAIGENAASEVKEVIEKEKLDVNQLSPSGRSLLHKASASGDLESIHTLVQHGAYVNILDQDGFPPLHSALRKAHYKCAIFLMECGADLNSYTSARVQEFAHITNLAEAWFGSDDYEQSFQESMFNTAL